MDSQPSTTITTSPTATAPGEAIASNGVLLEPFTAPAAVGTPAPAKPSVEHLVEDWFRVHVHGVAARLETPVYNALHAAKDELKRLLARA